jgi:hypothetical protein
MATHCQRTNNAASRAIPVVFLWLFISASLVVHHRGAIVSAA